jgi:hypothetical protein
VQENATMLRFAPRYGIISPALVRPSRMTARSPVNDNQSDDSSTMAPFSTVADARVEAALRLFAVHGLSAPECARLAAAKADARGDDRDARWWTEVGAMFARPRLG